MEEFVLDPKSKGYLVEFTEQQNDLVRSMSQEYESGGCEEDGLEKPEAGLPKRRLLK